MSKKWIKVVIGLIALIFIWTGISIYPDWLWFNSMGFSPVFWTMLFSSYGLGALIALLLLALIALNLFVAKRLNANTRTPTVSALDSLFSQFGLAGRRLDITLIVVALYVCYLVVSVGSHNWDLIMRFIHQQPFGTTDPIFGKDIGFYVFSLPFYLFVQSGLLILVVLSGLITLGWYLKEGGLQVSGELGQTDSGQITYPRITIVPNVKRHLSFLGGFIVLTLAWGFYLKMYQTLYSTGGAASGASYVDVNVNITAYKILIILSIGFALLLFWNVFKFRPKHILIGGGAWVVVILISTLVIPVLVQKLVVKPNELKKESPYIAYNIQYTRKAYKLDKIKAADFQVDDKLSNKDFKKHEQAIRNIRIWDERPLLRTFKQIQSIRLYYDFNDVDVDRYMIDNQYRQVMLAARELEVDQLPSQANTWVNRHLIYTHGYGLALSPVNEVTSEGLPNLMVKDLPPSYEPGLKIDRPEIYYGEMTKGYVLVNTKTKEFDFPKGDKNVYSSYEGNGGIPINSFSRRLLFAFEFMDPQILFTTNITPQSRIMYNRRIGERVRLIAPFLDYDKDPYLVISNGKLYWIQDAYTTSDMYPYSYRSHGQLGYNSLNYIRNSVKIVIDAYDGKMTFYMMDKHDPIVQTYAGIFPGLFKPFAEMPTDLKQHIRYPKDLFKIQAQIYAKYHMDDVQVFYNQEDLWQTPDELYSNSRQEMESYYLIVNLPDEEKEEFFLMLPFTPSKKDNMIAWLAARCDYPNYGNLLVYKLPKDKLVYGPMQIEARVDQQPDISRELSLWGQRGSRVIRGNLLAIPFGNTFIYVEPVYLEAKQDNIQKEGAKGDQGKNSWNGPAQDSAQSAALPELKRVIVAYGNHLVMGENLNKALNSVLDNQMRSIKSASVSMPQTSDVSDLGKQALEYYTRAKEYIRQGNWAEYGKELEKMEKVLRDISNLKPKK